MHGQRSDLISHEERRRVEAAILALVLAEDWPWRVGELAQRLRLPAGAVGNGAATLSADGLIVVRGDRLRASWTAIRGDELLRHCSRTRGGGSARPNSPSPKPR